MALGLNLLPNSSNILSLEIYLWLSVVLISYGILMQPWKGTTSDKMTLNIILNFFTVVGILLGVFMGNTIVNFFDLGNTTVNSFDLSLISKLEHDVGLIAGLTVAFLILTFNIKERYFDSDDGVASFLFPAIISIVIIVSIYTTKISIAHDDKINTDSIFIVVYFLLIFFKFLMITISVLIALIIFILLSLLLSFGIAIGLGIAAINNMTAIVVFYIMFFIASIVVPYPLKEIVEDRYFTPLSSSFIKFILLIVPSFFLVWFCFLGGWQFFI